MKFSQLRILYRIRAGDQLSVHQILEISLRCTNSQSDESRLCFLILLMPPPQIPCQLCHVIPLTREAIDFFHCTPIENYHSRFTRKDNVCHVNILVENNGVVNQKSSTPLRFQFGHKCLTIIGQSLCGPKIRMVMKSLQIFQEFLSQFSHILRKLFEYV